MIYARTAAAAIEAAVEWTMKQIQTRDEAPRSWDAGFPSIKASALLCLLPTFDPDRWLAIHDERIRLEARQFQHKRDCRWALTQPMVCPTCNELANSKRIWRNQNER